MKHHDSSTRSSSPTSSTSNDSIANSHTMLNWINSDNIKKEIKSPSPDVSDGIEGGASNTMFTDEESGDTEIYNLQDGEGLMNTTVSNLLERLKNGKDNPDDEDSSTKDGQMEEESSEEGVSQYEESTTIDTKITSKPKRKQATVDNLLCQVCGESNFTRRCDLAAHLRTHNARKEKRYLCQECGKEFPRSSYLHSHTKVHTQERNHKCPECGKGFAFSNQVKVHLAVHTGERLYTCEECGKSFTQNSALNRHKRIHQGIKPHVCTFCGLSFIQSGNKIAHERRHIEDKKSHECLICNKHYNGKRGLEKHVQYMHDDTDTKVRKVRPTKPPKEKKSHGCNICAQVFEFKYLMDRHLQRHHKIKLFDCDRCGKSFSCRRNLKRHAPIHDNE